jgi:hypothetical protein
VTVTNGGCTTIDSVFVIDFTSVAELGDKAKLLVFPNPASDLLYVDLSLKVMGDVSLEIISSDGRLVLGRNLTGSVKYLEAINIAHLPKGLYYIRVYNKDWIVNEKFLIQ